jgi:hypothetical protein
MATATKMHAQSAALASKKELKRLRNTPRIEPPIMSLMTAVWETSKATIETTKTMIANSFW